MWSLMFGPMMLVDENGSISKVVPSIGRVIKHDGMVFR